MQVLPKITGPLAHYLGIAGLILVSYFFIIAPFIKLGEEYIAKLHGPQTTASFTEPTPVNRSGDIIRSVADAAKSNALAAAVQNQAVQLNYAQQTISNLAQSVGLNSKFASGLTAGLTTAPPKVEVITVGTAVKTSVTPPPALASDDAIKRDLKAVLADTTIKTDVNTQVKVDWADKPISPVFAVYTASGASGVGLTLRKAPFINFDALAARKTNGTSSTSEMGLGVDHMVRGTSASIGAAILVGKHSVNPEVFVGIHF